MIEQGQDITIHGAIKMLTKYYTSMLTLNHSEGLVMVVLVVLLLLLRLRGLDWGRRLDIDGLIHRWCSFMMHSSLYISGCCDDVFLAPLNLLLSVLKTACIDSPPCSPNSPSP